MKGNFLYFTNISYLSNILSKLTYFKAVPRFIISSKILVISLFILCLPLFQSNAFANVSPKTQAILDKEQEQMTPDKALERLLEGNKRFMNDQSICPERNETRRLATVLKQKPFAVVVGCSDSRVPPEFAFDQGIGDIFVVRIAGNVVSKLEMDSVEYSALANDSAIIVVLGHQNCGAVTAVLENKTQDIESIADLIKPAVYKARYHKHNTDAELTLKDAIIINIQNSVARIKASRVIKRLMTAGKIKVVGAYYNLASGEATLVPEADHNGQQNPQTQIKSQPPMQPQTQPQTTPQPQAR